MGKGRLAEPEEIVSRVQLALGAKSSLLGETFLVSAGPTAEPIDPVRLLTNRSSGKMGFRLAEAARDRGAEVILVSGPSAEEDPAEVEVVRVRTASEMKDAILRRLGKATVVVMAAAVADYRPEVVETSKIKKSSKPLHLRLVPTDDILAEIGRRRHTGQIVVGFAAESADVEARARGKLEAKQLDLVVANDISRADVGFASDANEVTLVTRNGESEALPVMSKRKVAERILDRIESFRGRGRRHG